MGRCGDNGYRRHDGSPCGRWPIKGQRACTNHVGKPKRQAKAEGAIVVEVTKWGLGDTTVDPGETLLRLLSQSAARVERYSLLVAQAYDAAERLQWASIDAAKELDGGDTSAREKARQDMDRVFNDGAVAALIGNTYSSSESGVFASGEAIRALVELENQERDRCARFAKLALDAGIAERQVRIAEQLGQHVVAVLRLTLVKLGLEVTEAAVHAAVAESMKELVA